MLRGDVKGEASARGRVLGPAWRLAAGVLSGVVLASAFPPYEQADAAWFGLIPLLVMARFTAPRPAFGYGYVSGLVFWLTTLYWLLGLARTGTNWPLAILGWTSLSAYCALYVGVFCMVVSGLFRALAREEPANEGADGVPRQDVLLPMPRSGSVALVLAIPLVWVGFEYLRCVLFTGFPWNPLGVSQYRNAALAQMASWGGVCAVSIAPVAVATGVTLMGLRMGDSMRRVRPARLQVELMVSLALLGLFWMLGVRTVRRMDALHPVTTQIRVAAIQPGIEQRKKWTPDFVAEIFTALESQTSLAATFRSGLDLIVWPETSVPGPLNADPECEVFVKAVAREAEVPILVGTLEVERAPEEPSGEACYNSSVLVMPDGATAGTYRKMHLVPFGEYIPFENVVPVVKRFAPLGFSCRAGTTSTVFRVAASAGAARGPNAAPEARVPFSVLICFEDAMGGLARRAVRAGARFLVVQTNDAWFDPSAGSLQHVSHAVFRCVENRVPMVRAANTGVTCFIDRAGRIHDVELLRAQDWERGAAGYKLSAVRVEGEDMTPTPYTRYGDWLLGLPCAAAALAAFALVARREMR